MMHTHLKVREVPIPRDRLRPSHRLLVSSFPGLLRDPALGQNATKTRPKCNQNPKCEFFSHSAPVTYNFGPLKWLHFAAAEASPLPRGEGQGEGQTGSSPRGPSWRKPVSICGRRRKLTETDQLRPNFPAIYCTSTVAQI